jgi:hypothetical protein
MVLRKVTSQIESLRLHRAPEHGTPRGARDTGVANCSVAFQVSTSQGSVPYLQARIQRFHASSVSQSMASRPVTNPLR